MSATAAERLDRILYILPAAHRPGGATLDELAAALGVTRQEVMSDIETVTEREYYHPAGSSDSMCIRIEGERVLLEAGGEFTRPVRLNPHEALAVHVGLHALAAESDLERRQRILALAAKIAGALVAPEIETVHELRAPLRMEPMADIAPMRLAEPELEYEPAEPQELLLGFGDDVLRGVLSDAIAEGASVRLSYLKPGAQAPETRRVAPHQIVYAEGQWYVLGYDLERRDTRIFRLDRTLAAMRDAPVADPAALDRAWIARIAERGRAPYMAEADQDVVVRYSPAVARWVAERTNAAPDADGSVVVRHRVADPRWIVRHVLQFAGEAWIEAPESLRQQVAERALELSA